MSRFRSRVGAALAAGLLLSIGAFATPAQAASGATAYLRAAHFSPETPGVDVYLTSFAGGTTKLWLANVGYGAVSPYRRLSPGVYAVAMRPHGAAASTPPVLKWTLHAEPGAAYTAAGVGTNKTLHAVVLHDDLSMPPPGQARIRVIQAADRTPSLDVRVQPTPTLASGLKFGSASGYAGVGAGTRQVVVTGTGSSLTTHSTVSLPSGSVHSLVVLNANHGGGITTEIVTDAAGAPTMPTGAVPAGGGGTAPRPGPPVSLLVALLATLGLAVVSRHRHT
jgi:hypothetical protein